MQQPTFTTPEQRRRAVAWAVALTTGTPLAPQRYERHLLALYQEGTLTIEEVVDLLNLSVFQVLYHSRAVGPASIAQLEALLEWSRGFNAEHQITGLLLYSEGRYVQALEGAEVDVRALFGRIQRDTRHEQVVTIYEGPGPQRRFADWRMGFGQVAAPAVDQVLGALQASEPGPVLAVEDPHLQSLVEAFGYPLS
ncbi:BLUF domain-containing protein [Hymenobacter weizhouensis]|uniref:BLUF domain-containing protein n=1 Tax=Hymenobacter sp. YIM 151500-1 TaxID=2987689 RepID=UPI002226A6F6|nr:BLUF domain-containing protein [Hymenobacter sp. YIM 151500-1]UYZ63641.1 BLUF domain-containing protein [Hymenobacter sp. YIM 151500-1]